MPKHYHTFIGQTLHYFGRPHESIRREPLKVPAAWKGQELSHDPNLHHTFTSDELNEIRNAIDQAKATGKPLKSLTKADFPLPILSEKSKYGKINSLTALE